MEATYDNQSFPMWVCYACGKKFKNEEEVLKHEE